MNKSVPIIHEHSIYLTKPSFTDCNLSSDSAWVLRIDSWLSFYNWVLKPNLLGWYAVTCLLILYLFGWNGVSCLSSFICSGVMAYLVCSFFIFSGVMAYLARSSFIYSCVMAYLVCSFFIFSGVMASMGAIHLLPFCFAPK